jgi:hypothetical protein
MRRAQTISVAILTVLTGIAWSQLARIDWNAGLVVVPVVVACTAGAVFVRRMWAAVIVRAALWGSFVCGVAVGIGAGNDLGGRGLFVAVPAGLGLLCLGRFSRSLGRARPLLIALAALALADATMHALASTFILVDNLGDGTAATWPSGFHDEGPFIVFTFTALANAVGLACILRFRAVWPHVLGNVVVIGLAAADVIGAKPFVNVVIGGAALLQIALAILLKAPPAPRHVRRNAERALRVAIVLALVASTIAVLA